MVRKRILITLLVCFPMLFEASAQSEVIDLIKEQVMELGCQVYSILFYLATAIAALYILFSGIKYITSESPDDRYESRDRIIYAVIGLVVVLISCPLVDYFISGTPMDWGEEKPECCPIFSSGGSNNAGTNTDSNTGGNTGGNTGDNTVVATDCKEVEGLCTDSEYCPVGYEYSCTTDQKEECTSEGSDCCCVYKGTKDCSANAETDGKQCWYRGKSGEKGTCIEGTIECTGLSYLTGFDLCCCGEYTGQLTSPDNPEDETIGWATDCFDSQGICKTQIECSTDELSESSTGCVSGKLECEQMGAYTTDELCCCTYNTNSNPSSTDCDDLGGFCVTQDICTEAGAEEGVEVECTAAQQCSSSECCCAEKDTVSISDIQAV